MSERSLGNVVIAIKAVDEASSVMGKIQTSVGLLGGVISELGGGFAQVGTVMQGFAAGGPAGAVIAAAGEMAKGLQDAVDVAGKSEQVYTDLSVAIEKTGTAWDTVSEATRTALLHIQEFTQYSDEDAAAALQKLITFGIGYKDAMAALPAIIDFAAAKHMDLDAAAVLVGKAFDGNTAILARYGVEVTSSKDQAAELTVVQGELGAAIKTAGSSLDFLLTTLEGTVGITSQFVSGMEAAKDKTKFLMDAFKQGTIDLPQFEAVLTSLGVTFDDAKLKTADEAAILAKLNEQFGGTAQAQAQTYAGIQERLKNAMTELSEKVGMILLPALSGIAEQIIPVVTGFGQWVAEIAAMPDVKAIVAGVAQGFADTVKNMVEVTKAFEDTNTALTELLDSIGVKLPEGFTALNVIAKGFEYTWDMLVIFPLQETTMILQGLTAVIKFTADEITGAVKGITDAIGGATHQLDIFTQGFKTMADIVAPAVKTVQDVITATLKIIQDTLQGFYDWFVGGSLWPDLWNAVIRILQAAVPVILGILSGDLIKPIYDMLSNIGEQVQTLWTAAWTGLAEKFTSLTATIQATVSGVFDPLSAYLGEMFTQWAQWASDALTKVEGAITSSATDLSAWLTKFMGTVYQAWVDFGAAMSDYMRMVVDSIIATVQGAAVDVQGILDGMINAARSAASTIGGILSQIASSIQGTVNQAANAAGNAGNAITGAFTGAWNSVATAATNFYNWLVGHSLWPDLMGALVDQTQAGMSEVKASFEKGLGGVVMGAPTIPELTAAMNITGVQGVGASPTQATPAANPLSSITLPITINNQIDGVTVARTVERRLIANRQLSAWRSA